MWLFSIEASSEANNRSSPSLDSTLKPSSRSDVKPLFTPSVLKSLASDWRASVLAVPPCTSVSVFNVELVDSA